MDIKVLEQKDNVLTFLLKGANPAVANTLRRTIIAEVPTLAVKRLSITKNGSALFDEMLAHRIGLIPLTTDLKSYDLPKSEADMDSARCSSKVSLICEGPLTVYAEDLKFQDATIKPVYPKMVVVKLLKGQEIEFEGVVTLGQGKDHAKYTPGLISYKGYPQIKISKVKNVDEVVKSCPVDVFEKKGKELSIKNLEACHLCLACVDAAEPKESVKVSGSEKDFIFTIESWGQLAPKELLAQGLKMIHEKLGQAAELVKAA